MSRPKKIPEPVNADSQFAEFRNLMCEFIASRVEHAHERLAYSVDDLVNVVGLSRGSLITMMDDGRLIARKMDARTIVLRSELIKCLEALPVRPTKGGPENE